MRNIQMFCWSCWDVFHQWLTAPFMSSWNFTCCSSLWLKSSRARLEPTGEPTLPLPAHHINFESQQKSRNRLPLWLTGFMANQIQLSEAHIWNTDPLIHHSSNPILSSPHVSSSADEKRFPAWAAAAGQYTDGSHRPQTDRRPEAQTHL